MELLRAGISVATVGTSGGIVTSTSSDENNRDTVIGLSDGVGDGNISSDICGTIDGYGDAGISLIISGIIVVSTSLKLEASGIKADLTCESLRMTMEFRVDVGAGRVYSNPKGLVETIVSLNSVRAGGVIVGSFDSFLDLKSDCDDMYTSGNGVAYLGLGGVSVKILVLDD